MSALILDVPRYRVIVKDCRVTTAQQAQDALLAVFNITIEKSHAAIDEINKNGFVDMGEFTYEIATSYVDDMEKYTDAYKFTLEAEIVYDTDDTNEE